MNLLLVKRWLRGESGDRHVTLRSAGARRAINSQRGNSITSGHSSRCLHPLRTLDRQQWTEDINDGYPLAFHPAAGRYLKPKPASVLDRSASHVLHRIPCPLMFVNLGICLKRQPHRCNSRR